jgi:hypothetical protein
VSIVSFFTVYLSSSSAPSSDPSSKPSSKPITVSSCNSNGFDGTVYIKSAKWGTFLLFKNGDVQLSTTKSSLEEFILQKLDGEIYAIKSVYTKRYLRFGYSGEVNTQSYPGPFYIETFPPI